MSLRQKTRELKKRMQNAQQGGGMNAIEKQVSMGKLTARERILAILDQDSFHEYDLFVSMQVKILIWTKNIYLVMV